MGSMVPEGTVCGQTSFVSELFPDMLVSTARKR
jgi:hypothetical protein